MIIREPKLGHATTAELERELSTRKELGHDHPEYWTAMPYDEFRKLYPDLSKAELKLSQTNDGYGKINSPARFDAKGDPIPWAKEHDYFMGFDPDNPDVPTD